MAHYVIDGGRPLTGEIVVPGNKNAVLPAMVASLLTAETVRLTNVPAIRDVATIGKILADLGVQINNTGDRTLELNASGALNRGPNSDLVADLRASVLLIGPMLARFGRVTIRHPGGDLIGRRSIDQHLNGLAQMGAETSQNGLVNEISGGLHGGRVYLQEASVTATENIMMAAALIEEETVIVNAASEPHVFCLGEMLKDMGAEVKGHGTNLMKIKGRRRLKGCEHWIRPDHIEAGTWAIAAAASNGEITVHGVMEDDFWQIKEVLEKMGVIFQKAGCQVHTDRAGMICFTAKRGRLMSTEKIRAGLWPAFPTDLMSPVIVLATQCRGMTLAHDWMYEGRMFFVDRLIKMGANIIMADPHRVIINGPTKLWGRQTSSPDIRAGAALVIAALIAEGRSEIYMAELIDRGYEHLEEKLKSLGANITREND